MRKQVGGFENTILLGVASFLLLSAAVAAVLAPYFHLSNGRVQYGVGHLPVALGAAFLFALLVAAARPLLLRWKDLSAKSTLVYLAFASFVFCLFWLPALLAGGFDQDDWMLLAAASIRKIIYLHPGYSWYALDSVDGNFRPLGTVLYFGYLFQWFGLSPLPYLTGLFLVNLLGCLSAFFLVREMGYSKVAGAAASMLFLSRSITYDIHTWPSALGDALVILFGGLTALLLLRAVRRSGIAAAGLHLLAWACFFVATLAKQSAFAVPLIVALLLWLRPGQAKIPTLTRRVITAALGLTVYSGTAAIAFFHAKSLSRVQSPYPIGFSWEALLRLFAYPAWFLGTFEFPSKIAHLWMLPCVAGLAIVVGAGLLLRRFPQALGERPRDVAFCLLSAAASLSLFAVLANRSAPYYGSMAAFWASIAFGIVLTRLTGPVEGRVARLLFCLFLVTAFTDIRLQQTGLFPSGGYTWGTYLSSFDRAMYEGIRGKLATAQQPDVLILADMPGNPSHFACMALLADPRVRRILVYDSAAKTYLANDLHGDRPHDGFSALNDTASYNWTVQIDAAEAARLTSQGRTLRLNFHEGKIVAED